MYSVTLQINNAHQHDLIRQFNVKKLKKILSALKKVETFGLFLFFFLVIAAIAKRRQR